MCKDCSFEEALGLVDEIQDALGELPEEAEDFADGVEKRSQSIGEWVEKNNHVTPGQMTALQNMLDGCHRWIRE